ncbi:MAG: phosphoribosylglycinamide formyltransferase [Gemmatimonadetes bacterium]|nr:phosphoribosylglycinamide formyltransferase [Gemmatimonadota bacterium]
MRRVAVLASGGGSNLQAIFDHLDALGADAPATVSLVASDQPQAFALERARRRGVPAAHVPRGAGADVLTGLLETHGAELVVLAGYLRLVPAEVVRRWAGRILNIHPALLPSFGGAGMYGRRVHEAVLAAGTRVSGATVHFVDEQFDRGAIVAQWPVPVRTDDTADTLAHRVLQVEHCIYPWCVAAVARGAVRLGDDGRVHGALPYEFARFGVEGPRHPFVPDL